jgi:hypothetical protein
MPSKPINVCGRCRNTTDHLQELPAALVYTNQEAVSDIPRSDKAHVANACLPLVETWLCDLT